TGVYVPNSSPRQLLQVVGKCAAKYGGQDKVPAAARGLKDCRYQIPRGEIEIEVDATALGVKGDTFVDFVGPVSYRVVPGDLTGDYPNRWSRAQNGTAHGVVKVAHTYGEVRVWAED